MPISNIRKLDEMKEKVIGYLILRKPESMGDVEPYNRIFKISDKFYCGVDRSHLNDLIDDYYKKKLARELSDIVKRNIEESNCLFFPHDFIRNYSDAEKLYQHVNRNNLNEITAIQSKRIMDARGFSKIEAKHVIWLGYDLTILQGGSLILGGIYFKPALFSKWIERLNRNGLFDSLDDCSEYFNDYLEMAGAGEVEDHLVSEENSEPIRVGRILV